MRTIWIAAAGILLASLLFAAYMHFTAVGNRDHTAVASRDQEPSGAEQRTAAESGEPPAPVSEQPAGQPATTLGNQDPAEGSMPVPAVRKRRSEAAGQPVMTPRHSRRVREPAAPPQAEEAAVSRQENLPAAAVQPSTPPAQPDASIPPAGLPFAKLYVNGKVLVNGQLSTASYILAGDWIDTPDGTEATLVGDNFDLVLRPGSRLSVDRSGVELARGDVLVTTTSGIQVKTSSVSITPRTNPNARFEVFQQSDGVRVMTYQGSVLVQ
jgi:hypothetical protein